MLCCERVAVCLGSGQELLLVVGVFRPLSHLQLVFVRFAFAIRVTTAILIVIVSALWSGFASGSA